LKRIGIFLGVIGAALVGLFLVILWYLGYYQSGRSSLGGIMGQMMGTTGTDGTMLAMPTAVWVSIVILAVLMIIGIVGLGYFLAYPEIRSNPAPPTTPEAPAPQAGSEMNWAVLMRTSKSDEKKVLEVLAAHSGTYLQKFVVKEAGLSKLKTHRVVSRLAERGVVMVERSGNTNQVSLAPWVKPESRVSTTS
jgi:hypothetical protein